MKKQLFLWLSCGSLSMAIAAPTPTWHFTKADVKTLHRDAASVRLSYGEDPQEHGFLRLPTGPGPHPVAILIHGGCWLASVATAQQMEPLADALRAAGIATWNIEYRSDDNVGGGFPGTFLDIARATDYVRKIAPTYQLDAKKVVVIGHSAGGQLALWAASRARLPQTSALYWEHPLPLQGVIALGGIPDLKTAKPLAASPAVCGGDVIGQLVGYPTGGVVPAARYAETSPIDMLPIHVPQLLIYGEDDQVVPALAGKGYVELAVKKGDHARLQIVPFAAHHEYIVPNSVVWPLLLKTIREMQRHGA